MSLSSGRFFLCFCVNGVFLFLPLWECVDLDRVGVLCDFVHAHTWMFFPSLAKVLFFAGFTIKFKSASECSEKDWQRRVQKRGGATTDNWTVLINSSLFTYWTSSAEQVTTSDCEKWDAEKSRNHLLLTVCGSNNCWLDQPFKWLLA